MNHRESQFNLAEVRRASPLLVENLARLPNREAHLKRIWEIERRWRDYREKPEKYEEVVLFKAAPANAAPEDEFDIIYAGGTLGLLHAAVMAQRGNCRTLVDRKSVV